MNNTDKVYCPWCRGEMRIEHFGIDECDAFVYTCNDCGASSPLKTSEDEALQSTIARPLQKPLTLEEVKRQVAVWVEYFWKCKSVERVEPVLYVCTSRGTTLFDEGYCEQYRLENDEYGEKWRCWAMKPTDEEMEAEGWK